ncbi:transketolase [Verrucomicrobiota bacterium]
MAIQYNKEMHGPSSDPATPEWLEKKTRYVRNLVLDMCVAAETGHVTSSFSCAEIMVALYYANILRFDSKNPAWEDRDRFILSKGQASVILYPILADLGFFPMEDLDTFCMKDGKFGVHLQHDVPGVEITAGSLGCGFGTAAGIALAAKKDNKPYLTVALLGDGECYEGSIWETAMFATHNKLNNLVAIIDRNYCCATDFTEDSLALESLDEKWKAFGWSVKRIDGHSIPQILEALKNIRFHHESKPLMIIADTIKGKGVSFMSDVPLWHARAPQGDEAKRAKEELSRENK